mmetsp:Transcript_30703/g.62209  ORF Transcript_30703/g.62209 Transcript_30703/m.62209 type:complete len:247 (+) Transcript_30703:655-1395(+)
MLLIEYRRMMGNDMPCVEAEVEATSGGEAGVAEAVVADGDGEVVEVEVGEELAEGIARELKRETILATWWDSVTGMNTQILLHHNFHHHLFLSGALLHAISILLSKKLLSSIVYLGKYQFSRVSSARSIMMRTVHSEELDTILRRRITLEYSALALVLKYRQRSPQQLFVGTLERHAVHILSAVELVHSTNGIDVSIGICPGIYIGCKLLRLSPKYATSGFGLRIIPLPITMLHKVVHHRLDGICT